MFALVDTAAELVLAAVSVLCKSGCGPKYARGLNIIVFHDSCLIANKICLNQMWCR